jgi:hypothetical protein
MLTIVVVGLVTRVGRGGKREKNILVDGDGVGGKSAWEPQVISCSEGTGRRGKGCGSAGEAVKSA